MIGWPEECSYCGTPVRRGSSGGSGWFFLPLVLSLLLPGLGHLWEGRLKSGSLALFLSIVGLGVLWLEIVVLESLPVVLFAGFSWLCWLLGWTAHLYIKGGKRNTTSELVTFFIFLLLVGNGLIFIFWFILLLMIL